jgi:GT2 family glycosyltransferase
VHYRGLEDTFACLASLTSSPLDAILVDNSGCGEGVDLACREFPRVETIDPGWNTGFAGGCNLGIRAALEAGASHVLLVNNDATLAPGAVDALIAAAEESRVGIVTGKVLIAGSDPPRIWAAGGALSSLRGIGRNVGEGEIDCGQHDHARDVDFASGCFLLATRAALKRTGLFDERYFLYLEDLDLCLRARRAGFLVRFEPRAVASHRVHGATRGRGGVTPEPMPIVLYYLARNRHLLVRRHHPLIYPLFLAYSAARTVKVATAFLRGHRDQAWAEWHGFWDGLFGRSGARPDPAE